MRKTCKGLENINMKKRRMLPVILFLAVIILGGLISFHIYDEFHTYHSAKAVQYEPIEIRNGAYVLASEKKELLGTAYVAIVVKDLDGNVIYQCPELYRVSGFQSVGWEEGTDHIVVKSEEYGTVTYVRMDHTWSRTP